MVAQVMLPIVVEEREDGNRFATLRDGAADLQRWENWMGLGALRRRPGLRC